MTDSYAVEILSDHDHPHTAVVWMLRHGALDAARRDDNTVHSSWIVEGCTDAAQAAGQAAARVWQAPGCTHADWWPPQRVEVRP